MNKIAYAVMAFPVSLAWLYLAVRLVKAAWGLP